MTSGRGNPPHILKNNMDAKELMIGDKVMVKVLSQIPDTYVLHTWTANDYSRDIQVKPIPLSAKILEENGFWEDEDDIRYHNESEMWVHTDVNLTIEKFEGRLQCYEIPDMQFNYVHQIQQVLRLCRLNELADNFKVYGEWIWI